MIELAPLDHRDPDAPLCGVKVLEVPGELTGYAGKLLADLGAAVIVVDVDSGPSEHAPFDPRAFFLDHAKSRLRVPADSDELRRLIADTDVILQSREAREPTSPLLDPTAVRECNPSVVHAILTPFGLTGPKEAAPSTDLTRLAAGGLLWLGGYPDTEPVAAFGDQSSIATGIYGAVAVLLALLERERTGEGDTIEISSQEVMTQALETSIAEYELLGKVRRRLGDTPREAGTGIFPCADGHVSMVAGRLGTAAAWQHLVDWLQESGTPGADALSAPGWDTLERRQRPEAIAEFTAIFGRFASSRRKDDLYREGQRRGIAIAPVNDVDEVLADRQLAAREFFVEAADPASEKAVRLPAPPFRLSRMAATPVAAVPAEEALPDPA
jgi:benzylsuccinate CoA-transferase BbsE subunit